MMTRQGDRVEEIFKHLKADKLPFKIDPSKLNELGLDIAEELIRIFKGINMSPALKWCLSTIKKAKVFTVIYQANERGLPIYKEEKIIDKKVKNIRPSIELISSFYNWNIDRIVAVSEIIKKHK